ncbi:MAG: nuclear transport factor 2 family protein [Pseudomonadota bacterium]|nr:nuclear transport factor 2 family protein [Pseudomonadota bacterium]
MKRIAAALAALLLAPLAAAAKLPADLAEAARAYEDAQLNADRQTMERLVADDYVLVGGDGTRQTKQDLIDGWMTPGLSFDPLASRETVELVWTDGAALSATVDLSGTASGAPFAQTLRYVDIWKKTPQGWRVVYSQVTRVPAQ